jgi:hypothetical protein
MSTTTSDPRDDVLTREIASGSADSAPASDRPTSGPGGLGHPADRPAPTGVAAATPCCPPDEQASCCAPSAKAACCGESATGGCGCR